MQFTDIIKPQNDERIYKYCILDNNIKCILINDKTLDKIHLVTSVNIGSFANKDYYDGLAHLLEHMCFITSKKYQKKNYLASKVNEGGGSTNAFTAEKNTIYYLDIFNNKKKVEEIIEIFVDFLTNAELKDEYILNELNNVDAEHKKNINNDSWKLYNLEKILANYTSNYNGFFTGSIKSLNKNDLSIKIKDFYKKYYNANNISVCLASNYNIDESFKIINKYFGSIQKTNIYNNVSLIKPIYSNNAGKIFMIKTNGSIKILKYLFEVKENVIESKIFNLFCKIINSSEKNSCLDFLESNGLIVHLSSYYDLNGILEIKIILTDTGFYNLNFVNYFIIYSVNIILEYDWINIFENEKKRNIFLFNNLNKIDTLEICTDFLMKLLNYSPELIYISDYNYVSINQSDINILKSCINFKNCITLISNNKLPDNCNLLIDPNYQTNYCQINSFSNKYKLKKNIISYKFDNPYKNINPYFFKLDNENIIPKLINNNYWFGNTSKFKENTIYCSILFNNINYYNTKLNYLLTNISIHILNSYLDRELIKANEYNLFSIFNLLENYNSIELKFFLLNDRNYIQIFIDQVLNLITNKIDVTDELIKSKISFTINYLENIITMNPWEYCDYLFNNFYDNKYDYNELLLTIKQINIIDIKNYIKNIFNDSFINIFVYGNLNLNDVPSFNKLNINNINKKYILPTLKIKKYINTYHHNTDEKSNCVKISYFIGSFDPLINLQLIFINLISHTLFFDELRTVKQLGYLVSMHSSIIGNKYLIYQKIQSNKSTKYIIKNIILFNNNLINIIEKQNITLWKTTVINYLNENKNNLNELFLKYNNEIITNNYLFDRNEILLKYIDKISIESLINFINIYILNNNKISIIKINKKKL